MPILSKFKSTVLLLFLMLSSCKGQQKQGEVSPNPSKTEPIPEIKVVANRTEIYLPMLQGKKIGVVANPTSVVFHEKGHTHLVDSLLSHHIEVKQVFAPEHGFRGTADAGEHVKDGVDSQTGLPIVSLYGKNRKPSKAQLEELDVVVFDIQDVGVRFYTYIATLQLVMEACAENGTPIIVLDRPNPNGHYVDGPTMMKEHAGYLGLNPIPLVYGMTMGEYAQMLNGEGWLENGLKADLTVVPLENYTHASEYHLPIRPSPNLPNDVSITLYPSLGLFEGTNVNAGRGTEFQFQRYGASFMELFLRANFEIAKEQGKVCYGKDLSQTPRMNEVTMEWIIDAYQNTLHKPKFFLTSGFTKHAGTPLLQKQIEQGMTNAEIKATWQDDLEKFKKIREKYLIYD